jgi:predicted subunit of tRNA(5-methylaminomethyl-2-thiouridylate) methyltransferase
LAEPVGVLDGHGVALRALRRRAPGFEQNAAQLDRRALAQAVEAAVEHGDVLLLPRNFLGFT